MTPTLWLALVAGVGTGDAPDYLRAIKPLFAEKCFACHGALKQSGELRLDTAKLLREGGNSGPAIVAGQADASLLVDHLLGRNGKPRMPPPSDGEALKPDQIALIRQWIERGAPAPADEKPEADPRDHWAFRAVVAPAVPAGATQPVDAFLDGARKQKSLRTQPLADRRTLLRRVHLDLVGLPPTLEEQEAFLADASPDAYEKVVDRLLASPQHGERWARHWMDIWRYSDPWGLGAEIRNSQKHIWHWRDWIVESLTADKGYDQMVREMLAADELYPNDLDRLRASGFLVRPYFKFNRNTRLDEVVEHTFKSLAGLTMNCVKCHDHKYDPFPQADYYRLRAFFEPYQVRMEQIPGETDLEKNGIPRAFDCNLDAPTYLFVRGEDRQPLKEKPLTPAIPKLLGGAGLTIAPVTLPIEAHQPGLRPHVLANHVAAALKQRAAADLALAKAKAERADAKTKRTPASLDAQVAALEAGVSVAAALEPSLRARADADRAKATRAADAVKLAERAASLEKQVALLQAREALAKAEAEWVDAIEAKKPDAEKKRVAARSAVDVAEKAAKNPGVAYTPLRGALKTLESNVESQASREKPFPTTSTGRRTALAGWMIDRKNPLVARVAVNHVWTRHFGTPLVATVFDFGRKGAAPTHPELLDWLAADFMDHGWSFRRLHRQIVLSEAYRLASTTEGADPSTAKADPENKLYWRRHSPRMEAQAVRDSLLHLAGQLDLKRGGPSLPATDEASRRRSLYFVHSNNDANRFLAQFDDASVRECYRRSESIVPQQALALANSKLALTTTSAIAERLEMKLAKASDPEFVAAAFALMLGATPTSEETAACVEALAEWRTLAVNRAAAQTRARANLVHALANHHDFVTIR